jgi:hypothetical protein
MGCETTTMARKRTAHQQLDEHRQRVASEGAKFRELQEQQARAKAELERTGDVIAAAYASEDQDAIRKARKAKEEVMARVEDLEHRIAGASLRADQVREELAAFMRDHGRDLLDEREQTAREVAAELTKAVAAAVKAHHSYIAERQHVDSLVASVPGASPRVDGVSTGYSWEAELKALERAYRENPEAELPRPRWGGVIYRQNMDEAHKRLRAQRKPKQDLVETVVPGERRTP